MSDPCFTCDSPRTVRELGQTICEPCDLPEHECLCQDEDAVRRHRAQQDDRRYLRPLADRPPCPDCGLAPWHSIFTAHYDRKSFCRCVRYEPKNIRV